MRNHSTKKHTEYDKSSEDIRARFTALIFFSKGDSIHREYAAVQRRTSEVGAVECGKYCSQVNVWIRILSNISIIIRAVLLWLCRTQHKVKRLPQEDGVGMPVLTFKLMYVIKYIRVIFSISSFYLQALHIPISSKMYTYD